MHEMGKFMQDDIFDEFHRIVDEPLVEGDDLLRRLAVSPLRFHRPQPDRRHLQMIFLHPPAGQLCDIAEDVPAQLIEVFRDERLTLFDALILHIKSIRTVIDQRVCRLDSADLQCIPQQDDPVFFAYLLLAVHMLQPFADPFRAAVDKFIDLRQGNERIGADPHGALARDPQVDVFDLFDLKGVCNLVPAADKNLCFPDHGFVQLPVFVFHFRDLYFNIKFTKTKPAFYKKTPCCHERCRYPLHVLK